MQQMILTSSRRPNKQEEAHFLNFMRTEQIGQLIIKIEGQEDCVLTIQQKDADGRSLLQE